MRKICYDKGRLVGPSMRCKVYLPVAPEASRIGASKKHKVSSANVCDSTPEKLHARAKEAYAAGPVFVEPYASGVQGPYDAESLGDVLSGRETSKTHLRNWQ